MGEWSGVRGQKSEVAKQGTPFLLERQHLTGYSRSYTVFSSIQNNVSLTVFSSTNLTTRAVLPFLEVHRG
jgi:hypothetical protein